MGLALGGLHARQPGALGGRDGPDEAISYLASQGFVGKPLPTPCGSKERPGNVAFYSPKIAEPGASISLCISTGVPAEVYVRPTYTYRPTFTPPSSTASQSAPASNTPQPPPTPKPTKSRPKPR